MRLTTANAKHGLKAVIATIISAALLAPAAPARALTYHVDPDATGPIRDGLTWDSAFERLEDALAVATFLDVVKVAGGLYVPDPTGLANARDATFTLSEFVTVEGGYAGSGAPDPDARDHALHPTVLSGDLNGDDALGAYGENCRNVVTSQLAGIETVFDGFTITGGNADGVIVPPFFPFGKPGGGMYASGSLTLIDCRFVGNRGTSGAGMFSFEGSPALTRCVFEHNFADEGAALVLFGTDDPVPPVDEGEGGTAGDGSVAHGTPLLEECLFRDNHASGRAGAVLVEGIAENPRFTNCRFEHNTAGIDGGATWVGGGFSDFINCLFHDNEAGDEGGASYNDTIATFISCTIVGNRAESGGGLYTPFFRPTVSDSILYGNVAVAATGETAQADGEFLPPLADHSCVEGWTGSWGGEGNFGDDPRFVPGPHGCHYLSHAAAGQAEDSPCIDAGGATAAARNVADRTTRRDESTDTGTADVGFHYPPNGTTYLPGDSDFNGLFDLRDVARMQRCFAGAGADEPAPCCRMFDFDTDGDVDLDDAAAFVDAYDGA